MIRKDLESINKFKESTLKETIKHSFLYPQSDSLFKSISDPEKVRPLEENKNRSLIESKEGSKTQLTSKSKW